MVKSLFKLPTNEFMYPVQKKTLHFLRHSSFNIFVTTRTKDVIKKVKFFTAAAAAE